MSISGIPHMNRRQFLRLLGLGSAALGGLPLLQGCAIDPVTGEQSFVLLSESEEIELDRQQSPFQFSADFGPVQDRGLNSYLNKVGTTIAARSHRPRMPYSFRAVNAAYINAYAFPGGSIAATRGILVQLENEAELAALFGHEIGHVNARHTAEQMSESMLINLLVAGAAAATSAAGYTDGASLVQELGSFGAGVLLAHYSRDNEREADALGMEYMTRTGYNPQGMVQLMEVLLRNEREEPSAIELMFATHPMSAERLQWARQAAATSYRAFANGRFNRQRFMDHTWRLRKQKKGILLLQKATAALNRKKYQQADALLGQTLRYLPRDYTALVMRAQCRLAMDQPSSARRLGKIAIQVYPREAQGHIVTGMACFLEKRFGEALQQFTRYNQILPGNPEILFFQGVCHEGMGQQQQAAEKYYAYLQQVQQGDRAQYAYQRLKSWGYL